MGKKKGNQSVPGLIKIEVKDEIGAYIHEKFEFVKDEFFSHHEFKVKNSNKF